MSSYENRERRESEGPSALSGRWPVKLCATSPGITTDTQKAAASSGRKARPGRLVSALPITNTSHSAAPSELLYLYLHCCLQPFRYLHSNPAGPGPPPSPASPSGGLPEVTPPRWRREPEVGAEAAARTVPLIPTCVREAGSPAPRLRGRGCGPRSDRRAGGRGAVSGLSATPPRRRGRMRQRLLEEQQVGPGLLAARRDTRERRVLPCGVAEMAVAAE